MSTVNSLFLSIGNLDLLYRIPKWWGRFISILFHLVSLESHSPGLCDTFLSTKSTSGFFPGVSLEDGFHCIVILHKTSLVIICHHESKNRTLSVKPPSCRALPVLAQGLSDPSSWASAWFPGFQAFCSTPPPSLASFTTPYSNTILLKRTPPKEMGCFIHFPVS